MVAVAEAGSLFLLPAKKLQASFFATTFCVVVRVMLNRTHFTVSFVVLNGFTFFEHDVVKVP